MSKKSITNEIKTKLAKLGVGNDGCHNLDIALSNGDRISWVGYNQVMISHKVRSATYRNKRYPLYSKEITLDLLNAINSRLD